jgi:hypothetical protein
MGMRPCSCWWRALPRIGSTSLGKPRTASRCLESFIFAIFVNCNLGFFIPFVIAAQALIIAGFIRHALRPSGRDTLSSQPSWARAVYPAGIILLLTIQLILGFIGWDGASQIGAWLQAILVSLLTFGLVWATPRLRILNPIRAHWVNPATSSTNSIYSGLWTLYRGLGRISQAINVTLEGEGGIMWTLLFLIIFISLLTQRLP